MVDINNFIKIVIAFKFLFFFLEIFFFSNRPTRIRLSDLKFKKNTETIDPKFKKLKMFCAF